MKKTPILLSTMLLVSGGLGMRLPNASASDSSESTNYEILQNDPLTGTELSILSSDAGSNSILLDENSSDAYLRLSSIQYKDNQIEYQVFAEESWQIRRVVLAYRDYEGGVTEAEADAKLATLGEDGAEGWKILLEENLDGRTSAHKYITPSYKGKAVDLRDNLTDIVYYAVEFGHKSATTKEWSDLWWERGKVNYRSCVHSPRFNPETTYCALGDGDYDLVADHKWLEHLDEDIISWDDEWNAVLLQRLQQEKAEWLLEKATLEEREKELRQVNSDLSDDKARLETEIANLKDKNATLLDENAKLRDENTKLQDENMKLQNENTELRANNIELQGKNVELETKNAQLEAGRKESSDEFVTLQGKNQELQAEIERLRQGVSDAPQQEVVRLQQENTSLRREISLLRQEQENKGDENNGAIVGKAEELKATTETKVVVVEHEKEVQGKDDSNQGSDIGRDTDVEQKSTEMLEDDVAEIPNLGDLDGDAKMTWWWVLIAGVGALAALGLGIKRVLRTRRARKHTSSK